MNCVGKREVGEYLEMGARIGEMLLSKMDYSRGTMNCVLGNVNIE